MTTCRIGQGSHVQEGAVLHTRQGHGLRGGPGDIGPATSDRDVMKTMAEAQAMTWGVQLDASVCDQPGAPPAVV